MASFSNRAIKGIKKIGDFFLPGNHEFPSYSEAGGTYKLNDMVQYAPEDDIKLLNIALIIFSFLPKFVLKWLVGQMDKYSTNGADGVIPTTFRQLDVGLRGLLYATYYDEFTNPDYKGRTPKELIDFNPIRVPK
ncbi:MAG: hypothetical protein M9887_04805 [Chitinophagales bacterium]|nr:hypothetical protein [Chitinophagales bacterium]